MKKPSDLKIPFTWAERRSVWVDRFFYIPTHYDKHADWVAPAWSDPELFGNHNEIVIEYCSGNGQWICDRAKKEPNCNWVAVEKRFDRARKIWARMHRESIPNLLVVCGEGVIFSRYYVPVQSVRRVFVNFPDPWPKLRHAKHRIIRPEFLQELEKIVALNGSIEFVTDDFPYVEEMLQTVLARPLWRSVISAPFYQIDRTEHGSSYFAELWKSKGRHFYFLHFERVL